jgi:hypothetical protein
MQAGSSSIQIEDVRGERDFRGITFSGFQASAVVQKLQQACADRSVESACYWTAELVCAGHFAKLWECVGVIAGHRHAAASPRIPMFLAMRFADFKRIIDAGYAGRELELRNSGQVRRLFAEIVAVLCASRRHHPPQPVRINPDKDFDLGALAGRLEAPNTSFAGDVFQDGDPKELFVAVNELCYHLRPQQANAVSSCYWVEWLSAFARRCASRGQCVAALPRDFPPVPDSCRTDPIWLAWGAVLRVAKERGELTVRGVDDLLTLYCIRYTRGCKQRRRPLLYAAVSFVTAPIDFSVPAAADPQAIRNIVSKADAVYREIKKNEHPHPEVRGAPRTAGRTNRERTAERLMRLDAALSGAPPGLR